MSVMSKLVMNICNESLREMAEEFAQCCLCSKKIVSFIFPLLVQQMAQPAVSLLTFLQNSIKYFHLILVDCQFSTRMWAYLEPCLRNPALGSF